MTTVISTQVSLAETSAMINDDGDNKSCRTFCNVYSKSTLLFWN